MNTTAMNPDKTIPTSRTLTGEEWRAERRARMARDASGRALDLKLAVMDEIDRAVDGSHAERLVVIPASADDFVRASARDRVREANGFTFVPLSEVRLS